MLAPKLQREATAPVTWTASLTAWVRLLRPNHWTKNLFCFAGLFFSGRYVDSQAFAPAILTFVMFSVASSAGYIFNDLLDVAADRRHPKKRFRPLASGEVSSAAAGATLVLFAVLAVLLAASINALVLGCLILYFMVMAAYSLRLKQAAILDVFCIATGFMLRLLAGIYAVHELPTGWITICTLFLTLFLGFSKRRSELQYLLNNGKPGLDRPQQRPVLAEYQLNFLDSLLNSTATMAILTYALFTATSGKGKSLILTTPVVVYAVMRYKQLVMVQEVGEEPEKLILTDKALQVSMVIWLALYFLFTHTKLEIFN